MTALVVLLAIGTPVAAATVLGTYDQTGNGYADTWAMDDSGDGVADRLIIDADEDGQADIELFANAYGTTAYLAVDSSGTNSYDAWLFPYYANGGAGPQVHSLIALDVNEDGLYENSYFDGQMDGYYEWVFVDTNYDGAADTWTGNSAPHGYTAVDEVARNVARIESVNILRTAGIPVFFPSGTIPMGG